MLELVDEDLLTLAHSKEVLESSTDRMLRRSCSIILQFKFVIPWNLDECNRYYDGNPPPAEDPRWLKDLNCKLPCPKIHPLCKWNKNKRKIARHGKIRCTTGSGKWVHDKACSMNFGLGLCWCFHKGASGCIRSKDATETGAGQQCCYNDNLKLITGGRGGGTADIAHPDFDQHRHVEENVLPFGCCLDYPEHGFCSKYSKIRLTNNGKKRTTSYCEEETCETKRCDNGECLKEECCPEERNDDGCCPGTKYDPKCGR